MSEQQVVLVQHSSMLASALAQQASCAQLRLLTQVDRLDSGQVLLDPSSAGESSSGSTSLRNRVHVDRSRSRIVFTSQTVMAEMQKLRTENGSRRRRDEEQVWETFPSACKELAAFRL